MANLCPNCKSSETQTGLANTQCLTCGSLFDTEGNTVEPGMDQSTRAAMEARMAPRATVVVGNFADLQRAGAEAASSGKGSLSGGVELPAGLSADRVITPAEDDARKGQFTRETERTGLLGDELTVSGDSKKSSSRKK